MIERLPLTVLCKSYRYDGKMHGCAKHGECHSTEYMQGCVDFDAVARAGSKPLPAKAITPRIVVVKPASVGEYQECGGCKKKAIQ